MKKKIGRPAAIALRVVLVAVALGGVAFALTELVSPPVGDAPALVAALDATHHGQPAGIARGAPIAQAIVAAEDEHFYSHHGVDTFGLIRAAWGTVIGQDLGGSTVDQQLAKTIYTRGDRGLISRVVQVALSLKLEGHFSKDAILSMYLSAIYFGHGFYGIHAASRGYFGVDPSQLTWAQATLLAGLPQAPSHLDPFRYLAAAKRRQRYVLDRLVATGKLTQASSNQIFAKPLGLRGPSQS